MTLPSPDAIWIDWDTEKVELFPIKGNIERILPYISPELTGRSHLVVDQRSDLYSLGVIFYEMLTGYLPFHAEDALGWVQAHLSTVPKPPFAIDPEVPDTLSNIVMKLLAKSPRDRYQTITALRVDLDRCREEWHRTGRINQFAFGQADLYQHLLETKKLIGRDREMNMLAQAYEDARRGQTQAVLISGSPGIGKTALVSSFREMVNSKGGYFLSGKCSPVMGEVPYVPFLEVLSSLVRQILEKDQKDIDTWKHKVRKALGRQGNTLTAMIPELAFFTGEFLPVPPVPRELRCRFFKACTALIDVFAHEAIPLTIFLDDLQWLDPDSLELISFLVSEIKGSMLLIGAYRSDANRALDTSALLTKVLRTTMTVVREIRLEALSLQETKQLITSIIGNQSIGTDKLAYDISRRSGGIPLFVKQSLASLYQRRALYFSFDDLAWKYTGEAKKRANGISDTGDLISERINQMPPDTVKVLKLAACLGRWSPLDILSATLEQPVHELDKLLRPAVESGIIRETTNLCWGNRPSATNSSAWYEFTHDRMAEAVYSLLSEEEKKQTHLRVGQALLDWENPPSGSVRDIELFTAVSHLNKAVSLIENADHRLLLANYNFKAAQGAWTAVAFQASLHYSEAGIKLLPPGHWRLHHQLSFELYLHYYRCKLLLEGGTAAQPVFRLLTENARTAENRIRLQKEKTLLSSGYAADKPLRVQQPESQHTHASTIRPVMEEEGNPSKALGANAFQDAHHLTPDADERFQDSTAPDQPETLKLQEAANASQKNEEQAFTDRELEILNLMAAGLSNREIAQQLHLAEGTVKWHSNRLFQKLGVETRTQAVVRANELGLLNLGRP